MSMLGPRSKEQMKALEQAVQQSCPWFSMTLCSRLIVELPSGLFAESVYADALRISEECLHPQDLNRVLPSTTSREAFKRAMRVTNGISKMVEMFVDPDHGHEMVRARSLHGARDSATLVDALKRAGAAGISRGDIAAEYDSAYLDIEKLELKDVVFATEHHVWHRDVTVKKVDGLYEEAKKRGLVSEALL